MAKSGHHFPSGHGFTKSTGKVQTVSGYTRAVPKKAVGGPVRPVGMSGPKMIPRVQPSVKAPFRPGSSPKTPPASIPQAPTTRIPRPVGRGALAYAEGGFVKQGDGTMKTDTIGDQGNSVVKRGDPPYTTADKEHGGTGPLRTGYKKGGPITKAGAKAVAKAAVAKHVAAPAPKGHKGFSKTPMFGKK